MGAGPSCNHCDPDKLDVEAAKPSVEILDIRDAVQSMEVGPYKNCGRDEEKLGGTYCAQQTFCCRGPSTESAKEALNPKPLGFSAGNG